jgi:EAL domain-containing protein (putative c-di-GMP-specific phosphodiesterase class I)
MPVRNHNRKDPSVPAVGPLFQPRVTLRNSAVIGVECQVPRALGQQDLGSLTELVLGHAIRAAGDWWRSGLGLQLSVPLSTQILSDRGWRLDELVAQKLGETGLPGSALQLELPGEALIDDPETAELALHRLVELGACISITNFGVGYFSLRQLQGLPLRELKVDNSLISGLFGSEENAIVRSTIHLAHHLDLRVVAGGLETDAEWRRLRAMGCDRAQGSLIARPLSARQVPAWLASWSQRAPRSASRGPSAAAITAGPPAHA